MAHSFEGQMRSPRDTSRYCCNAEFPAT